MVESRKRPLEETADLIEVKREKSDIMEGKFMFCINRKEYLSI